MTKATAHTRDLKVKLSAQIQSYGLSPTQQRHKTGASLHATKLSYQERQRFLTFKSPGTLAACKIATVMLADTATTQMHIR